VAEGQDISETTKDPRAERSHEEHEPAALEVRELEGRAAHRQCWPVHRLHLTHVLQLRIREAKHNKQLQVHEDEEPPRRNRQARHAHVQGLQHPQTQEQDGDAVQQATSEAVHIVEAEELMTPSDVKIQQLQHPGGALTSLDALAIFNNCALFCQQPLVRSFMHRAAVPAARLAQQ